MSHKSSRSGLFLLELIMSILFFSIAGAVCVRLFVNSHVLSQNSVELNHALEWSQNVAELFYGCNGNPDQILNGISRIYCHNTELAPASDLQEHDMTPYPVRFQLIFDRDFEPAETRLLNLTDTSSASDCKITNGYLLTVDLSEDGELIFCNICTQKLPLLTSDKSAEPVYQLNLTLFPSREVLNGN